jgi:enediyne biosynthesis protein E2
MPTALGSVRRFVMTPKLIDVTFAKRGFPAAPSAATQRLEAIPQAVICGFEWGIDARDQWEVERRLSLVDREQLGFAYEGATMAFTILDATGRGHRTRDLLRGPGRPHIFLAYIGMGFAMARLPRPVWKKVLPDLTGDPYYPVMSWLAVDGFGFDRAYFDTGRWVDEQRVPKSYPWAGAPDYFPRAVDQGIGRALWFICGGSAPDVAAAAGRFASHRQADLWSGIGLAATFAGGCDADGLAALRRAAGGCGPDLSLGAVFAVKARAYAGFVPDHTQVACLALTDASVDKAVKVADDTAVSSAPEPGSEPPYETWRQRIRAHFAADLSAQPSWIRQHGRSRERVSRRTMHMTITCQPGGGKLRNLTVEQCRTMTLEAFADTFVPGEKRFPGDIAVAGAAAGPGAVAAGALELLETPATGVSDGLADLADSLNEHAAQYAAERGIPVDRDLPSFAALGFEQRTELIETLVAPDHPEKEFWILTALFCFMAFDTAAHTDTVSALKDGHPGLVTMGFAPPDPDGLWRFPDFSYGRQLARTHPATTPSGDPA